MLKFLPSPLVGAISLFLYTVTTILWALLLFFVALLLLIPIKAWRKRVNDVLHRIPVYWADTIAFIIKLTIKTEWDVRGLNGLRINDWYLIISNHRSWVDIVVLQQIFNRKIPPLRFFMKKELLWQLPFVGIACWLLDYPFMERYSKEYLAKHPEKKGKDVETTRKACDKFKNMPITMINFIEGGRFSEEKHQQQKSPYKHLIRPKAGGAAFVLETMGEYLHKIINVTIIYPKMNLSFWDFLCGRADKIIVDIKTKPITKELLGDYEKDAHFRSFFQYWLNELWAEKDKLIANEINQRINKIDDGFKENISNLL